MIEVPKNARGPIIQLHLPASITQTLISAEAGEVRGVTVDGTYVYWTNTDAGKIGRAKLDGTEVNQALVEGISQPRGVGLGTAHVYWASTSTQKIGRAKFDGSEKNNALVKGLTSAHGLAVGQERIYWTNGLTAKVGRANLIDLIVKNNTTGLQLAINLPAEWDGTDLIVDFYRRLIRDINGIDRSALLDPTNHALWSSPEPLVAGLNDFEVEAKSAAGAGFAYAAEAVLSWEQGHY
jgi:hypothetical protein